MKNLLAIINEPKESLGFIQYVTEMATVLKSNVSLLHVQNPDNYPLGTTGAQGAAVAHIQQNIAAQINTAKKTLVEHIKNVKNRISEDIIIRYSAELGVTSQVVSDIVSEGKTDMVIIEGQKDKGFWTQTPNNMEIIENVDCPVWIIPTDWLYKPFTKIVYATDYKEEDITGIKRLVALTGHSSPVINVLHITQNVDFEEKVHKAGFLEILQNQVSYNKLTLKVVSDNKTSNVTELLNGYAELIEADLIVIMKENRTFFERIFQEDTTKKIIKNANVPVLVLHQKE